MSKRVLIAMLVIFIVIIFLGISVMQTASKKTNKLDNRLILPRIMELHSGAFGNNEYIPKKYTCDSGDINPPLSFLEVPLTAKSLVLTVTDPDSAGGDWAHWLVWNISPDTKEIVENSKPEGATEGKNDFGKNSYGGPCPPSGTHRYVFNLYALDTILEISDSTRLSSLEGAMSRHVIDQATLIGLYQRTK
jgi:Raf kinase inhibitor-like YbhB/YbcL family protein